jgi:DNA polymerase-3 subunit alpha
LVSQFDNLESAGLLKWTFRARTLTIIKDALKLVKARHGVDIDPDLIPLDDAKTYQLFKEGRTVGFSSMKVRDAKIHERANLRFLPILLP